MKNQQFFSPTTYFSDSIAMIYAYKYGKIRKPILLPKKIGSKLLKPYRKISMSIFYQNCTSMSMSSAVLQTINVFLCITLCAVSVATSYELYVRIYRLNFI